MDEQMKIAREAWRAWQSNDREASLAVLDEEVEWHRSGDEPEVSTLHGPKEVARMWREWVGSFDDFRIEPLEFIDAGERIVVPFRMRGRMPGSSAEVAVEETHVYSFRNGKVVEVREYRTKPEALEAAGLSSTS